MVYANLRKFWSSAKLRKLVKHSTHRGTRMLAYGILVNRRTGVTPGKVKVHVSL
jgi:hypothetical protein